MSHSLRKRHQYMWLLIVLVVPIVLLLALTGKPSYPTSPLVERSVTPAIGELIKEYTDKLLSLRARGVGGSVQQVEIELDKPLKAAAAVVFDGKGNVIGKIGAKGVYRFSVDKTIAEVVVIDTIKDEELTRISL